MLAESWAVRRGEYEKLMAGEDFFVFLAEVRSLPVGYALVHMRGDETESGAVAELETLTVLPEHRGRGIGATLYEAVLAELRRRHVGRISVSAIASNEGAIRFYERQGLLPYMRSFVGSVAGVE